MPRHEDTPEAPPGTTSERPHDSALHRIRLRHLQCVLAVAQCGTLRSAALALSITQPAVTKTLNELEGLLGQRLFARGRQGAAATPAGEAFMRHAHDSLSALGRAVESLRLVPEAAPLRIGALPTVAPSFLPGVLRAFAAQSPATGVQVGIGRNAQLIEQLRAREIDAVIGRLADPELMAGLSFEPLYAEPVVIALRPGHALAPRSRAAPKAAPVLAAIGRQPLVLPFAGTLIRQVADAFLARHGVTPQAGVIETLDTSLARALVLQGDHLWFTPLGAVSADLETGALVRLALGLTPDEPVGLMLRTESSNNGTLHAFVGAVRSAGAQRRAPAKRRGVR